MKLLIAMAIFASSHLAIARQVPGELLVKLKSGKSLNVRAVQALAHKYGIKVDTQYDLVPGLLKV